MRVTRLRVSGFKSFSDPVELPIGPGLTGVVGPNGCGKSNVVEALRWVMGETSPKGLRGGEMDDVIFNGSAFRAPFDLAEVALRVEGVPLGATDHGAAGDLEVVRRIGRGAGSAYRISGREARARDVQILFADAASGARSAAIVGQGQIGQIVEARPDERRRLLEEAAGIGGLHARRREAASRLETTSANLARVTERLADQIARLDHLARQAEDAERYRRLQARLRALAARLGRLRLDAVETARTRSSEALAAARELEAHTAAGLATAKQTSKQAAERLAAARVSAAALAASEARLAERHAAVRARVERLRAEHDAGVALLAEIEADLQSEVARHEQAFQRRDRLGAELTRAEAAHEAAAVAEAAAAAGLVDLEAELDAAVQAAMRERSRAAACAVTLERCRAALREARTLADARIAASRERHRAAVRRREQAERTLTRARERAGTLEQALARAGGAAPADDAGAAHEAVERAGAAADAARIQAERAAAAWSAAREAHDAASSELRATERQLDGLRAEASALAALLPERAAETVADRVEVEEGYAAALAAALGDDLMTGLDGRGTAHWRDLGPLDSAPSLPAGATALARHVTGPSLMARRLAQVGVVAPADTERLQAELRAGQRLVTRAGDLWRWDGLVRRAAASEAAAWVDARARLSRLAPLTEAAGAAHAAASGRAAALGAELARAEAKRAAATTLAGRLDGERGRAVQARAAAEAASERRAAEHRRLIAERDTLAREIGEDEAELAAARAAEAEIELAEPGPVAGEPLLTAALEAAEVDAGAAARAAEAAAAHERTARASLAAARERAAALGREAVQLASAAQAIAVELEQVRAACESSASRLPELQARAARQRERMAGTDPDAGAADLARSAEELRLAQAELVAGEAEAGATARALADAEAALGAATEGRDQARVEVLQGEILLSRLTAEAQAAADLAQEAESRLVPGDEAMLDRGDLALGPDELGARLARLEQARDRAGPVNLRATSEHDALEQEITATREQQSEVEVAVARLQRALQTLDAEARSRLLAAFAEVEAHFRRLFARLFGGGRADLRLTGLDDPLAAGLELVAQPPGKKLTLVSLLSGGEKSLTGLALVFAFFLARPSPLCVLDEVDAPLDDANVERFVDLLAEIAQATATRFLVVTHHPLTMARMDRLYGVTMVEKGVSRVVSVSLDDAVEMRQAG